MRAGGQVRKKQASGRRDGQGAMRRESVRKWEKQAGERQAACERQAGRLAAGRRAGEQQADRRAGERQADGRAGVRIAGDMCPLLAPCFCFLLVALSYTAVLFHHFPLRISQHGECILTSNRQLAAVSVPFPLTFCRPQHHGRGFRFRHLQRQLVAHHCWRRTPLLPRCLRRPDGRGTQPCS